MRTRFLAAGVVTTGMLALTGAASADTVDMRFVGVNSGLNARITTISGTRTVFAGQIRHEFSNGTGLLAALNGEHLTYCVDLEQTVSSSPAPFTLTDLSLMPGYSPMGAERSQALNDIFAAEPFWPSQSFVSNEFAAGLQLAIWDIVTDYSGSAGLSSLGLDTGTFRAAKQDGSAFGLSVMAHYQTFLSYIGGGQNRGGAGLIGLAHPSLQDQMIPMNVPVPGVAAASVLGVLAAIRRRR